MRKRCGNGFVEKDIENKLIECNAKMTNRRSASHKAAHFIRSTNTTTATIIIIIISITTTTAIDTLNIQLHTIFASFISNISISYLSETEIKLSATLNYQQCSMLLQSKVRHSAGVLVVIVSSAM